MKKFTFIAIFLGLGLLPAGCISVSAVGVGLTAMHMALGADVQKLEKLILKVRELEKVKEKEKVKPNDS